METWTVALPTVYRLEQLTRRTCSDFAVDVLHGVQRRLCFGDLANPVDPLSDFRALKHRFEVFAALPLFIARDLSAVDALVNDG